MATRTGGCGRHTAGVNRQYCCTGSAARKRRSSRLPQDSEESRADPLEEPSHCPARRSTEISMPPSIGALPDATLTRAWEMSEKHAGRADVQSVAFSSPARE